MGNRPLRILVLSFYYRPDLSAGSFRITALVEQLRQLMPAGSSIEVLTTLPNRYSSYSAAAPELETFPGGSIRRIALPAHRSGMADQSRSFLAFARQVMAWTRGQRFDLVFASSSRLMTALLASEVARRSRATLYLDIRDIFADTIKDVLRGVTARVAGALSSRMERVAIGRAAKVSLVSGGFLPYFTARYPTTRFECFTNGVDDEFLAASPAGLTPSPRRRGGETVSILYAGNIGESQGLHTIIPPLAQRLGQSAHFRILGDGGRRAMLEQAIADQSLGNVTIEAPVPRGPLIQAYREADVLFLHLNDYPAFKKVLPSKIFEYAAMGKPVWAGVAGFAAEFIRREIPNAAIFHPGDVAGAVGSFATLRLEDQPRAEFSDKFGRSAITRRLAEDLLATANGVPSR